MSPLGLLSQPQLEPQPQGLLGALQQVQAQEQAKIGDIKKHRDLMGGKGGDEEYEYIGIDPRAVRPDDPRAGSVEDHDSALEAWRKWDGGNRQGLPPSIDNLIYGHPDSGVWRRVATPTS